MRFVKLTTTYCERYRQQRDLNLTDLGSVSWFGNSSGISAALRLHCLLENCKSQQHPQTGSHPPDSTNGYIRFHSRTRIIKIIRDIIRGSDLFRIENYLQQNKFIIDTTKDPDSFPISRLVD